MQIKNIIVVGATGLVGQEFVELLSKHLYFANYNITLISNSYDGNLWPENLINEIQECIYKNMNKINYDEPSIIVNCANKEQAVEISKNIQNHSILIDNSSEFRMDVNIPLIIPEINFNDYKKETNIIANPNCSTIILCLLLNPFIKNNINIKRIVMSTYQAASGAGKNGLDELMTQSKEILNGDNLTINFWKQQYIYNMFVHDSKIDDNDYCEEENKLINETNKIFNSNIAISPTCIRVPIMRSHCESVNIEFYEAITIDKINNLILSNNDTLELIDNKKDHIFPSALSSNNNHKVQVGHVRKDYSLQDNFGWNFWISGDQILRGAAYNAFLIMKKILLT